MIKEQIDKWWPSTTKSNTTAAPIIQTVTFPNGSVKGTTKIPNKESKIFLGPLGKR